MLDQIAGRADTSVAGRERQFEAEKQEVLRVEWEAVGAAGGEGSPRESGEKQDSEGIWCQDGEGKSWEWIGVSGEGRAYWEYDAWVEAVATDD